MNAVYYSTGQAARELGVTQAHVRTLYDGGLIGAETTPGGQWRIAPSNPVWKGPAVGQS